MRVLSIKLDWNGGVSEYKVTSDRGCAYKNLMKGTTKLAFQEYIELYNDRVKTRETLQAQLEKSKEREAILLEVVEFYELVNSHLDNCKTIYASCGCMDTTVYNNFKANEKAREALEKLKTIS